MSRVPRIRFKGFEEDWEQRKLGEIADIIGGGTPSTLNLDYWDGNIDWYSPAEIIDQIYVDRSQRKITELGFEKSSAKMLPEGTVLFTSRAGIGKTAILAKKGCTNQGFQSIVPHSNKLDSYFIFSRTEELKKYGEFVGAGSTFVEVSGRQMENMQLMIPKTIGEQHIIGVLFSTFDHLITLHQRKLEKLKIIKRSMLENLFPQNEEKTPKIRFSVFTEDWEQRKLGEVVVIERGGSPRPIEKYVTESNDGLNWIKIGDAPVQGRYITKTSEKIKESGLSKTRQVFPGDLILSNSMSFGKPYIMGIEGCIHDGWLVIKNKNNVFDLKFLCHMLSTEYLFNQYKMFAAGSTVNNLNKELVGNASVRFPKMSEQRKIGQYLESLDHLITLHQSKLVKLQKIKKSMLESMFV